MHKALWLGIVGGLLANLAACSDANVGSERPRNGVAGAGAGGSASNTAGASGSSSVRAGTGGGGSSATGDPGPASQLNVTIEVSGEMRQCGSCALLFARVSGGAMPYSYAWSDPALTGAGPHQVCPDAPVEYAVTVTDTAMTAGVEFDRDAMEVADEVELDCAAAGPDAGAGDAGGGDDAGLPPIDGCFTLLDSLSGTAPSPETITMCPIEGSELQATVFQLGRKLAAGERYEGILDLILPIPLSEPGMMEIWGSSGGCKLEQKLGSWSTDLDLFNPRMSFCAQAEKDYTQLILMPVVPADATAITGTTFTLGGALNVCRGCNGGP
jgi:hypothetical protein